VVGVNPGVKIMAVRAGQDGWLATSDIVEAINFAKYNGAKIINASRGDANTTCESVYDQAIYEAIEAFS
jgi:subtilisin family serine protease